MVAGVVVDPSTGEVFTALRGGGARRNGEAVACSAQTDLAETLVGTGFNYAPSSAGAQAEVLAHRSAAPVRDIRRMGAASVDLCSVACGRLDAYFERGFPGGTSRRVVSSRRRAPSSPPSTVDRSPVTRSWHPPLASPRLSVSFCALSVPMCRESPRSAHVTGSQWLGQCTDTNSRQLLLMTAGMLHGPP